jgi:hypothetical protein
MTGTSDGVDLLASAAGQIQNGGHVTPLRYFMLDYDSRGELYAKT